EGVREGLPPVPLASARRRSPGPDTIAGDDGPAGGLAGVDGTGPAAATGRDRLAVAKRATPLVAAVLLALFVFGSRGLFGSELPAVGQLPNLSRGWSYLWGSWWSTWQPTGLGVAAPASPALGLLGVADTVVFGASGTLQHILVLGPLIVGPLGAYRAARWWGSRRGRLAALIVYAVVPLPYDALARGDWGGLLAYAAAPWVLSVLGRLSDEIPFPMTRTTRIAGRTVGLALVVALVAAAVPSWLFVVPIMGLALLGGSALAGRPGRGVRMLLVAVAAAVVAFVLLLPWSASVLGSGTATLGAPLGPAGRLGLGHVLRFETGPLGHGPLGWALLVVAALPLFIAKGWRLAWAARMWVVALVFFGITWAGLRGWVPALPAEVGLAPAAAALSASAALGAVAFELDLPGYRFGWRQLAAGVAVVALGVGSVPMVVGTGGGRWHLPSADAASVLTFLPDAHSGDYRVLWVGSPEALPLAGRELHPGVAYATSFDGEPAASELWLTDQQGAAPVLASDLRLVEDGLTTKVGHLLAPTGVLYLVIPNHNGPAGSGAASVPTPSALLTGLQFQTDLQLVNVDPNYTVYRNAAWSPARSVLPRAATGVASEPRQAGTRPLQQTDLTGARAVFAGRQTAGSRDVVPTGSTVYLGDTRSGAWSLHVGGTAVAPRPAFGWAMSFAVPSSTSGAAHLELRPSVGGVVARVVEILLWLVAIGYGLLELRRRRSQQPSPEVVRAEWFAPTGSGSPGRRRRSDHGALGAEDLEGDEVWIDV
ncbi:MAG: hypothetical protein ACRDYY_07760, partial [Acidimicrobiales bacterium]